MLYEIKRFTSEEVNSVMPEGAHRIVLYGCGDVGSKVLAYLRDNGVEPVAFSDGNPVKWGKEHMGLPIVSPADCGLSYGGTHLVVICLDKFSYSAAEMEQAIGTPLREAGCLTCAYIPQANITAAEYGCRKRGIDLNGECVDLGSCRMPNFMRNRPANVVNGFSYVVMDYLFTSESTGPDWPFGQPYDNQGFTALREGDVVLDCGANLGIFSAHAAAKSCTVHAFEPEPTVFSGLVETSTLYPDRIFPHCMALGDATGRSIFSANNQNLVINRLLESGTNESGMEVSVTTVDDFVEKQRLGQVDFIKADIEGGERLMLRGAAKTLRDYVPRLAICAYHLPDDPEILPAAILAANPRYTVRHVGNMLYAWV